MRPSSVVACLSIVPHDNIFDGSVRLADAGYFENVLVAPESLRKFTRSVLVDPGQVKDHLLTDVGEQAGRRIPGAEVPQDRFAASVLLSNNRDTVAQA